MNAQRVEAQVQEQMHSLQDAYVRGEIKPPVPEPDEDYYDLGEFYGPTYEADMADRAADRYEDYYERMWER